MSTDGDFTVRESHDGGTVVLFLQGDLDIAAADELQARLEALKGEGRPVVLDLRDLKFMDSSGMACIAQAVAEAQDQGWDLQVGRELHAQVQRLIELVNGETLFWPMAR